MIAWLLATVFSLATGAGWFFAGGIILALFFPRLLQFLFAYVVFPYYAAFFGLWIFLIGWAFDMTEFTLDGYINCALIGAVPAFFLTAFAANGASTMSRR